MNCLPLLHSARILTFILSVVVIPVCALSAQTSPSGGSADATDVVLTISGGVSLGSYQSGVNWALIEFFRATRDPKFRSHYPAATPHSLRVATGASAGNINALLSVVEWCRDGARPTPPEESAFWEVWIPTGWDQLFSPEADGAGVFNREFFREEHLPRIDAALTSTSYTAGCLVDVGLTMTRLVPDVISLSGGVNAVTQRHATVFRSQAGPDGLTFSQVAKAVDNRRMGQLIFLDSRDTPIIPNEEVFEAVLASSAFPLAFEPVNLRHRPRSNVGSDGLCRRSEARECLPATWAVFLDGGVFDNNPIGLAAALVRLPPVDSSRPTPSMVYIDSERFRKRMGSDSTPPRQVAGRGARGVLELVRGAVPAAQQYEMQAFARSGESLADSLNSTSRGHPIIGDRLGHFGAFLGRIFREHDFYVGAYDGAVFVADHYLCGDSGDSACVETHVRKLLSDTIYFDWGPVAPTLFAYWHRLEFDRELGSDTSHALKPGVLEVLANAIERERLASPGRVCRGMSPAAIVCSSGLEPILNEFGRDPLVRSALREWTREEACHSGEPAVRAECGAETGFLLLTRNPARGIQRILRDGILRMAQVERRLVAGNEPNERLFADLVAAAYMSTDGLERYGTIPDPSSIPGPHLLRFFPYYFSNTLGVGGLEFGYRPTVHLRDRVYATFPFFPVNLGNIRSDETGRQFSGIGVGILVEVEPKVLSVEVAGQFVSPWDEFGTTTVTGNLNLQFVNKIRAGLRWAPDPVDGLHRGSPWGFSVGVADLNGLIYWTQRVVR